MRTKLTLRALGALFVAAIAALVVAGCGVGANNVASIGGSPISVRAFNHWMYISEKVNAASSGGQAPVIVPSGPPQFKSCIKQVRAQVPALATQPAKVIRSQCSQLFTSVNNQVMNFLVKAYWFEKEAKKAGIHITNAEYQKLLKSQEAGHSTQDFYTQMQQQSGMTPADIRFQLTANWLYDQLVKRAAKKVTPKDIAAYYKQNAGHIGTPETRDFHMIRTDSQAQAQKAYKALKSGQSWNAVAKNYSKDAASKSSGGMLTGIPNGQEENALNKLVFSSPVNKVEGPAKGNFGWYVVSVAKIHPGNQPSLAKATPDIRSTLLSRYQQAAALKVNKQAQDQWKGSTQCAKDYVVGTDATMCAGYKLTKAEKEQLAQQQAAASSGAAGGAPPTGASGAGAGAAGGSGGAPAGGAGGAGGATP